MKLSGGAKAKRREFADANPGLGRKATPGRTRTARELGGACLPEGLQRKGERVAPLGPRTRHSLAPPARARAAGAARFLQTRPPLLLQLEAKDESREVWGEVGGAPHARAACKRREGKGERDPRQRYRVNTQSGAGLTPPPTLTLLAGRPHMGGADRGVGEGRGRGGEEGAGGQ